MELLLERRISNDPPRVVRVYRDVDADTTSDDPEIEAALKQSFDEGDSFGVEIWNDEAGEAVDSVWGMLGYGGEGAAACAALFDYWRSQFTQAELETFSKRMGCDHEGHHEHADTIGYDMSLDGVSSRSPAESQAGFSVGIYFEAVASEHFSTQYGDPQNRANALAAGFIDTNGEITPAGWEQLRVDIERLEANAVRWLRVTFNSIRIEGHGRADDLVGSVWFDPNNRQHAELIALASSSPGRSERIDMGDASYGDLAKTAFDGIGAFGAGVLGGSITFFDVSAQDWAAIEATLEASTDSSQPGYSISMDGLRGSDAVGRLRADAFTRAFFEALVWSSTDDNGDPLDKNYGITNLETPSWNGLVLECLDFQQRADSMRRACGRRMIAGRESDAGHDFALTRNGHGAGFWDGDWPEPAATELTKLSKEYGEVDLYVGDDGLLWASGYETEPSTPGSDASEGYDIDLGGVGATSTATPPNFELLVDSFFEGVGYSAVEIGEPSRSLLRAEVLGFYDLFHEAYAAAGIDFDEAVYSFGAVRSGFWGARDSRAFGDMEIVWDDAGLDLPEDLEAVIGETVELSDHDKDDDGNIVFLSYLHGAPVRQGSMYGCSNLAGRLHWDGASVVEDGCDEAWVVEHEGYFVYAPDLSWWGPYKDPAEARDALARGIDHGAAKPRAGSGGDSSTGYDIDLGGPRARTQYAYDVFLHGKEIDTVFYKDHQDPDDVKRSLVNHDGYDLSIEVVDRSEGDLDGEASDGDSAVGYNIELD